MAKQTALLLEDDQSFTTSVTKILEEMGYEVTSTRGTFGIKRNLDNQHDLYVLDLVQNGHVGGLEALQMINRSIDTDASSAIVITSDASCLSQVEDTVNNHNDGAAMLLEYFSPFLTNVIKKDSEFATNLHTAIESVQADREVGDE